MKRAFLAAQLFAIISVNALELPEGVQRLAEYQTELALSMSFLIAFLGGIFAVTSPCGFVLLPAFFSYAFKERRRAFAMTLIFSLGMSLAFVIFGAIAGFVGNIFNSYKDAFAIIAGGLLVFFGALLFLNKGFSLAQFSIGKNQSPSGIFALGFLFAVGWTPCVGPILGGVGLLAAMSGSLLKGAMLFGVYALGSAVPLLLAAYLSDRYDIVSWFSPKPIYVAGIKTSLYNVIAGLVLVIIGFIIVFDAGTGFFMDTIPNYLNWRMTFFIRANDFLLASDFLKNNFIQIGGFLAVLSLFILAIIITKKNINKEIKRK